MTDEGSLEGWRLQLILSQEGAPGSDSQNYVGALTGASEGWDGDDYPDPPLHLDGTARLHIDRRNRGQLGGLYATDYLPAGGEGWTWPLRVESVAAGSRALLTTNGAERMPEGTMVALVDMRSNVRIDLTPGRSYTFYPGSDGGRPRPDGLAVEHPFRLVVGTQAFVDGQTAGTTRLPERVELRQNYPNPFNPTTTIRFALAEPARVRLTVWNVRGQRVAELADGLFNAGPQEVMWDGRNEDGRQVASGIYFYRLEAGRTVLTKKMTLIR
jgi:hypothetical protein